MQGEVPGIQLAGIAGEHLPTIREFKHLVASRSYLFEHYTAAA